MKMIKFYYWSRKIKYHEVSTERIFVIEIVVSCDVNNNYINNLM